MNAWKCDKCKSVDHHLADCPRINRPDIPVFFRLADETSDWWIKCNGEDLESYSCNHCLTRFATVRSEWESHMRNCWSRS